MTGVKLENGNLVGRTILLVHNVEPNDVAFNDPLKQALLAIANIEEVNYKQAEERLKNHTYDGVIISGAPLNYDFSVIDSRLEYMQWVKTCEMPVLGICLGHQNIARLFGAQLIIDEEAEDGACTLEKRAESLLFDDTEANTQVEHHRGSVTLPKDFILLASTEKCRNQAMKHKEKAIYGVQFHPELSESGKRILRNFVVRISEIENKNNRKG